MNDYSKPYIALQHLLKDFHDATLKGEMTRAYEISVDITDMAQHLEDLAQKLTAEEK